MTMAAPDLPIPHSRTCFDDLPTEILLVILNDPCLQSQDYYKLALLSRDLNALALPLYFKAYGVEYPLGLFYVDIHGGEMDAALLIGRRIMAGLYIAIHLKSIPTLVCNLRFRPDSQVPYTNLQFDRFRARLASFTEVIKTVHSLAEVLIIGDEGWGWRTSFGPLSDLLLQNWTAAMGDFMNAVLEKGCTSLEVSRERYIIDCYQFHRKKLEHQLRKLTQHLPWVSRYSESRKNAYETGLRGPGWEFRRPGKTGYNRKIVMKLSDNAQQSTNIRHLYLHSTQFLLPPHLPWTLLMIRASPNLTSLSFSGISMEQNVWEAVLPVISQALSSQLRELAFTESCNHISSIDIFTDFLQNLNHLEHLKIDYFYDNIIHTKVPDELNGAFRRLLPSLRVLTAPIKFSNYILRPRTSNSQLQSWTTFYVMEYPFWDSLTPHSSFAAIFHDLSSLLRKNPRSEPLQISMRMKSFYHARIAPRTIAAQIKAIDSLIPLQGVGHVDITDFLPLLSGTDPKSLTLLVGKIFPDSTVLGVEDEILPFIREALERSIIPNVLGLLLDWVVINCPSVNKLLLESWIVDLSKGRKNAIVSRLPGPIYRLKYIMTL